MTGLVISIFNLLLAIYVLYINIKTYRQTNKLYKRIRSDIIEEKLK